MRETEHLFSRSMSTQRIAGLYDLDKTIGQGHYAVVRLARHVFTGEQVLILSLLFSLALASIILVKRREELN